MAKSRKQIQKGYRESKKKSMEQEYFIKERERTKKYYVATAELSATDNKKRRERVREQVKKFRKQQKDKDHQAEIAEKRCETAEDYNLRRSESISQSALPLIVNFNFKKGKKYGTKEDQQASSQCKEKNQQTYREK